VRPVVGGKPTNTAVCMVRHLVKRPIFLGNLNLPPSRHAFITLDVRFTSLATTSDATMS
jgi:hypothetical protein